MKRLLIVSYEYYPKGSGIANVAHYVAEELKRRGYTVTVLSSGAGDVRIDIERIKFAGIFAFLVFWMKAAKYIEAHCHEYDVVWVHQPHFLRTITAPNIQVTVHTTYVDYYKKIPLFSPRRVYYLIAKGIERYCYTRNSFSTTAVSTQVKAELRRLGVSNPVVVHNGVDVRLFKPRAFARAKSLLFVGRLDLQKRTTEMIVLFREMHAIDPTITYDVIGVGALEGEMKALAKDFPIRFHGKVAHNKLLSYYEKASAYILVSAYEGQPLTLLEALSCGCPPIVTPIGPLQETVRSLPCSLTIKMNNKKADARAVVSFLHKIVPADRKRIRHYAERHLSWRSIVDDYQKQWKKVKNLPR